MINLTFSPKMLFSKLLQVLPLLQVVLVTVVFISSGTIIECEARDESFVATILTSATFLQGPAGESSIPPNLEVSNAALNFSFLPLMSIESYCFSSCVDGLLIIVRYFFCY